jgi:UDP-N-acetylglucosamine:LPS N-acetylglucosamine transferase
MESSIGVIHAKRSTILILTTHLGGGHLNLAQSLKDMLETNYDVVIANPQSTLAERSYTAISRHWMKFLTWQFFWTDNAVASFCLHQILTLLSYRQLRTILERVQPQFIITTHAMLSYATARATNALPQHVLLIFQLTDLGQLHMTWFTEKHADAYLAPTREIFAQSLQQGIDPARLYLTGRPVRRQFIDTPLDRRHETLSRLNFDPTTVTIFLQGGAKGSANVDRTIEHWLSLEVPLQIILATGNNTDMAARYAKCERVHPLPFTEHIAPYMAAADVIAGKAGASFIVEAFMVEKPFLATTFIPGQETPNLTFIEQHNLGWVCLDAAAQQALLHKIALNPGMIAEKVESIRAYKAWNTQANQEICRVIAHLLPERESQAS